MAELPADDRVRPGEPPRPAGGKKGRAGHRRGGAANQLPALLAEALDEKVVITIDGRRRRITKREAMVAQLVDKSAAADLRAVKLLLDMQKLAEAKAGIAPSADAWVLDEADEKVIDTILLRLALAEEAPKPENAEALGTSAG
jgi:hypothetical protein